MRHVFDAVVVGAGPAGSTAAERLARAGASVALLDRARFPRDKPCGGGLTVRAVKQLPFPVDEVVEDVVDTIELRLRYRRRYERVSPQPLVLMTQRRRLDAFLAAQATRSGADFRDGCRVAGVEVTPEGVAVDLAGGERVSGRVLIGADGANGVVARALDLHPRPSYGVGLEGNLPYTETSRGRFRGRALFELGVIQGGYGWAFPKAEHVNIGVGGWEPVAPTLRTRLAELCRVYGTDLSKLREIRGHRLPIGRSGRPLARGPALVVGDAAGLVDPFSGDGIYEAFLSARLASETALAYLAGSESSLEAYNARVKEALAWQLSVGWAAKAALERFPWLLFTVSKADFVQAALQRLARGESRTHRSLSESALKVLARLARDPAVREATAAT